MTVARDGTNGVSERSTATFGIPVPCTRAKTVVRSAWLRKRRGDRSWSWDERLSAGRVGIGPANIMVSSRVSRTHTVTVLSKKSGYQSNAVRRVI